MTKRLIAATLFAAVAIFGAPAAGAAPDDDMKCGKRGGASKCQSPGHASLHSEPAPMPTMPSANGLFRPGWMPGYGRGQLLPVVD